jgi:signal transduction histidine kinase
MDLNRAVESTLTLCRNEWKFVAEVETRLSPTLPAVPCVPGEVRQVLLNLLINASQAIEDRRQAEALAPGGRIVVSTAREGSWVRVNVADNGCGVAKDIASRVFEPYFTTKDPSRRIGQGLAIAKALVEEKHKGTLTFESTPGHGTVFTLRLPLAGDPC